MNKTMMILMFVPVILMLASLVLAAVWVYRDAKKRGLPAGLWVLLVVLSGNFIGLILYLLIGRKQTRIPCPHCGMANTVSHPDARCSFCGERLPAQPPDDKRGGRLLLIPCIVCISLAVVSLIIFFFVAFTSQGFAYNRQYSYYNFDSNGYARNVSQESGGDVWSLSFGETSREYVFEKSYRAATAPLRLVADVQSNGEATLMIRQDDATLLQPLSNGQVSCDLSGFGEGKLELLIYTNGATDFSGEIRIILSDAA